MTDLMEVGRDFKRDPERFQREHRKLFSKGEKPMQNRIDTWNPIEQELWEILDKHQITAAQMEVDEQGHTVNFHDWNNKDFRRLKAAREMKAAFPGLKFYFRLGVSPHI